MGFDLYGLNPKIKEGSVKPSIDWETATEKDKEDYYEAKDKFENDNKGYYFRLNVWWWRPLANFIIEETKCVEDKDRDNWHYNDNHEVNETTALMIVRQLKHLLKTGRVDEYEKFHAEKIKQAEKHNEKLEKLCQQLREKVIEETKDKKIVPRDYPEKHKKVWDKIFKKRNPIANYPFSKDCVIEFIEFAENSGGFTIG